MQTPQELLTSEFDKRKKRNANFSLRSFAKWLGISPAQLSQMMTGKRPITLNTLKKITDRLGLSPLEKKNLLHSILKDKDSEPVVETKMRQMQEDEFRLISDWFHFAILILSQVKGANPDPRWIARRLGIGVAEAHQALLRLERLGVIQTKPVFKQLGDPISVLSSVPSDAIRKYHKQLLGLAMEKIETVPVHQREFQSISIPLSPKNIGIYKKAMDDFLEQVSHMTEDYPGSEIYHMNVQLFPATLIKESEK